MAALPGVLFTFSELMTAGLALSFSLQAFGDTCTERTGKTTCQIEWRGFRLDRYFASPWGFGGNFRTRVVAAMIGIGRQRLFGKSDDLMNALAEMVHAFVTTFGHLPLDVEVGMRELGLLAGERKPKGARD